MYLLIPIPTNKDLNNLFYNNRLTFIKNRGNNMNSNIIKSIAVMLILISIPASTAYEIRGTVVDNQTGLVSWNAQNFAGFYYDINKNISSETLIVTLSGIEGRTISKSNLSYVSEKVPATYKLYEKESKTINGKTEYQVLGWRGEKWIAVGDKANKIAKLGIEMDTDEKKTLTPGNVWDLGSGYELSINSVDAKASPRQAWLTLKKNGITLDDAVVGQAEVYEYSSKVLGDDDVMIFAVYIDSIFSGANTDMLQLKYGWMMYTDTAKEIKSSDTYGLLEVIDAGADKIELQNKNTVTLSRDSVIDIMDNLKFKVADSNTLRFYPKIDTEFVPAITPISTPDPTPVPTPVPTQLPVTDPTPDTPVPSVTTPPPPPVVTTEPVTTPITVDDEKGIPGFSALLAIVGIIGIVSMVKKRK